MIRPHDRTLRSLLAFIHETRRTLTRVGVAALLVVFQLSLVVGCKQIKLQPRNTVARFARNAGVPQPAVEAISRAEREIAALSPTEAANLQCRLGRVFQARKGLLLLTFAEAGATKSELLDVSQNVDDIADDLCARRSSLRSIEQLGARASIVESRLVAGTSLEGQDLLVGAFEDMMRGFTDSCFGGEMEAPPSLTRLAQMTDRELDPSFDALAMGRCSGRAEPGPRGGALTAALSTGDDYAECVRDAFSDASRVPMECDDLAGQEGGDEPDEAGEPPAEPEEPTMPEGESAADRLDEENYVKGVAMVLIGTNLAGAGVVAGGTLGAVGAVGPGVGIMIGGLSLGLLLIREGGSVMRHAVERYVDRNGHRPAWEVRSCPTLDSPAGPLAFATATPITGEVGPRMTVMDAMRACRCEHNPLDELIGSSSALGAFGGSSCDLGQRLACLRDADDDMGIPNPECMRRLQNDNDRTLSQQMRSCFVISCGTASMIGEDCSCSPLSGGAPPPVGAEGPSFGDPCAGVRCPDGRQPVPEGVRCSCREEEGPSLDPGLGPNVP